MKKILVMMLVTAAAVGADARPHGGFGHHPPPMHHHHHHGHSAWGRGGRHFWPGFVGGIVGGALVSRTVAAPAPVVVTPAPVVVPEPVAEAAAEETGLENDELIAVITAALAAFNKDGNKTLVVRSVRRAAAKTPAWAKAGRADQLASRF